MKKSIISTPRTSKIKSFNTLSTQKSTKRFKTSPDILEIKESPRNNAPLLKQSTIMRKSLTNANSLHIPDFLIRNRKKIDSNNFYQMISTPYDEQIQSKLFFSEFYQSEYKYQNKNVPKHMKKEKIQQFIFEQKQQNKLKYSSLSKINHTALPVANGTLSIMLNGQKKDQGFNLTNFKKKIPARSKFKMKWKTIQWLHVNRKDSIQQVLDDRNYKFMIKFARNREGGMNRNEFGELLSYVGLGADKSLGDKLFYVFDEDNSGTVDYKELIVGLELLKEDSIEDKLKVFFDLCDEDGSGKISETEIIKILRQNMINSSDVAKLKQTVRQMIQEVDQDGDGELDKNEILLAAKNSTNLRQLLEETISNVKQIDNLIENDLEEPFHQFIPVSANFVNYKEGIHFPTVNRILRAIGEIEQQIDGKCKDLRKIQPKLKQGSKGDNYQGLYEQDYTDSENDD